MKKIIVFNGLSFSDGLGRPRRRYPPRRRAPIIGLPAAWRVFPNP
ncbi:hypothetical protein HMPREF9123_0874 [Neisseria bacilliformis ATCC BAA-1200]|uniref:Uncharacterized protein n=1 Tax=Neisseria bacilliformis ATCC BAA-1200 TaxID=888742 RepID=F2BAX0_9NEIS|nr:hypothetical protein HMPREF9123_0874 [Neisseria bacilliformis ATCC BAA-1200]